MKKFSLAAIAALTAAVTLSIPMNAQAADWKDFCTKSPSGNIIIGNASNLEQVKDKLKEWGIDLDTCLSGGGNSIVVWPESPGLGIPGIEIPGLEIPGVEIPEIELPEIEGPNPEGGNGLEEGNTNLSYAEQVVKLVNAERAKNGLSPLTLDYSIESAALVRAKEIQNSFSHTRPDGRNFSSALKEQGVSYIGSGENIAWGQHSPEEVMKGWMNSPGHRANILNSRFTKIGVGHFQNSKGTNYWTQLFTY